MPARSQFSDNRHSIIIGRLNPHRQRSLSSHLRSIRPHLHATTVKLLLSLQTLIYRWEEWKARIVNSQRIDVDRAVDQCVGCARSLRLVSGGNAYNARLRAERNG